MDRAMLQTSVVGDMFPNRVIVTSCGRLNRRIGTRRTNRTIRQWKREASMSSERVALAQQGRRLEYFTIGWNCVEGLVAIGAGLLAGSISLIGFGADSFIEVTSGAALLWRMGGEVDPCQRERREHIALRIVGICFLGLATYVAYGALRDL